MDTRVLTNLDDLYFTSDLHLNHERIIEYCHRPFGSIEEMNKTIISNWNNKVPHGAWVFILGDFCLGNRDTYRYFLNQLSGHKILIMGNHDKDKNIPNDKFAEVIWGFLNLNVKDEKEQRITLCHYPMLSWYQSHRGAWQLFGHWHSLKVDNTVRTDHKKADAEITDYVKEEYIHAENLRPTQLDVGVDAHDFTPLSYYEVKKLIWKNLKK